jgi:endoglucanase
LYETIIVLPMNKFAFIFTKLLLLLLTVSVSACKPEPDITPELILAKESIEFTSEGATVKLAIRSNLDWTAVSSDAWCTVTPASGVPGTFQLNVSAEANPAAATREASLTITAGSLSKTVIISQGLTNSLTVSPGSFDLSADATEISLQVSAGLPVTAESSVDWMSLKSNSADGMTFVFSVGANTGSLSRTGTLTFNSGTLSKVVTITQESQSTSIPDDATGMSSSALQLAANMHMGWNLGNTLEVPGSEVGWGNPMATQTLIDSVKAAGFNTIRIPCAWDSYIEDRTTHKIKDSWLQRVKEVIDYCYNNQMYVIINIHWDGGWLEENPTYAKQAEVNAKQRALWEQIAVYFRDYDEHLLFAGTNEVHADYGQPTQEHLTVQMSYNQTFVDAVRSTGGRNTYRTLVVQAYNTNINLAVAHLKVPVDPTSGRMMVEVHYYDPYEFTLDTGSGSISLWGEPYKKYGKVPGWGLEAHVKDQFGKMKTNFVDKGYPVILGEYGAQRRSSITGEALEWHLASRAYFYEYVTREAKNAGLVPVYWDNGFNGNNTFALFTRSSGAVYDRQALKGLMDGANAGNYPF